MLSCLRNPELKDAKREKKAASPLAVNALRIAATVSRTVVAVKTVAASIATVIAALA